MKPISAKHKTNNTAFLLWLERFGERKLTKKKALSLCICTHTHTGKLTFLDDCPIGMETILHTSRNYLKLAKLGNYLIYYLPICVSVTLRSSLPWNPVTTTAQPAHLLPCLFDVSLGVESMGIPLVACGRNKRGQQVHCSCMFMYVHVGPCIM